RISENGEAAKFASCCPPAALRIRENFEEVEKIARIFGYKASVSHDEKMFFEERIYFAEKDFLDILKFKFIKEDPSTGIDQPGNAFISRSTAVKYFGTENVIGNTFSIDKKSDYQIVGVFEDIPQNSHLKFDFLLGWEDLLNIVGKDYDEAWGHTGSYTYLKVKPNTDPIQLDKKFAKMIDDELGEDLKQYKMQLLIPLQPLEDIHLTSNYMQEYEVNGDLDSINFLFIIALFIIVMAWVNYINLSTARSINRAKEVGLRKVVGATRKQLISQFFVETFILNLIAILLAIGIIELLNPYFSSITGIPSEVKIWYESWIWIALPGLLLVGVFLSGFYPVLTISSFKPIAIISGKFSKSAQGVLTRKVLVAFQFILALALITGTLTISKQISFMQEQDLGFNIEQTLIVKGPRVREDNFESTNESFKETILKNSSIKNICMSTEVPGRQIYWDAGAIHKQGEDPSAGKNYQIVGIDYDYIDLFDLEILYGRPFSREYTAEDKSLILNETAVKWMGFESSEVAVGAKVSYWGEIFTVVGVMKDFHQQSLKEEFEPHIYRYMPTGRGTRAMYSLNVDINNVNVTIEEIQNQWNKFYPGNPFEFFFLDEYYNQQYKSDELFEKVFTLFAFLAIFITALGIFGLSSFSAVQRTKEIGIRKVLGAKITDVLFLLTKDFIIILGISFLVTLPLLYFGLNTWLEDYANRMSLNIWLFILPLFLVGIITLLTVSHQTIKAANTNPVKTLRHE
ncbi:MAG: ABC transporter permease, partial [Ignavibacteriae bacterium]|nr:ABC transporter permease [Ignavibacteriota bacterium]